MEQQSKRKAKSSTWVGGLCPKMEKSLDLAYKDSRSWIVSQADDNIFEVHLHSSVLVDIGTRTCSYFQWQLNGFPCSHTVVAFRNSGENIYGFIDLFYHVDEFKAAYSAAIYPIVTVGKPKLSTNDLIIAPPIYKRPPGRPKCKQIPSKGEVVHWIRFGRCGKIGYHNRKTCKEPM
ncbi:hypothetical protein ACSBR2_017345 [Camellia fascicularis]